MTSPTSTTASLKEASPSKSASTPATTTPKSIIPRKIWYKLGPKGLTYESRERIETCRSQNPTYESEILTDGSDDIYVSERFIDRPDIVQTYLDIPIPILKADFLRYLILFADGGIWSDLDVTCEGVPIDDWVPGQYLEHAGLVVGWEFDVGWINFQRQIASWTMMAKPGSPHLAMVIDDILEGLHQRTEQYDITLSNLTYKMIDEHEGIIAFSGPMSLTQSIMKSVEFVLGEKIDVNQNLSNLLEPKLVGDILVLPGYAFALSSNHYAEDQKQGLPLVKHHYAGTWKNDYCGEKGLTAVLVTQYTIAIPRTILLEMGKDLRAVLRDAFRSSTEVWFLGAWDNLKHQIRTMI